MEVTALTDTVFINLRLNAVTMSTVPKAICRVSALTVKSLTLFLENKKQS
jgi:hypothetical protein